MANVNITNNLLTFGNSTFSGNIGRVSVFQKNSNNFWNKIGNDIEQDDKYYVIGSEPNNKDTINHELAHAFYYLYPAYKKKADLITDQLPQKIISGITSYLLSIGYNKKVLKDEFQAYLCSNADIILNEVPKRNQKESKKLSKLHCDLIDLLEEYKKIS
jgi:hypothetical protein